MSSNEKSMRTNIPIFLIHDISAGKHTLNTSGRAGRLDGNITFGVFE
jgi:hypothetical protein